MIKVYDILKWHTSDSKGKISSKWKDGNRHTTQTVSKSTKVVLLVSYKIDFKIATIYKEGHFNDKMVNPLRR
jgi:hypothetical protein